MNKSCAACGCEFEVRYLCLRFRRKFCSMACRIRGLHKNNIKLRKILLCLQCGDNFTEERGPHVEKIRKYCSRKCADTANIPIRRSILNGHWKGGISSSSNGYLLVTSGENANHLMHRVVMEKHLGRKLKSTEIVHHINKDKTDNRLENLAVMTRSAHASHHLKERWRKIT